MNQSTPPDLPFSHRPRRDHFEPMPDSAGPIAVLEALLKFPGRIIYQLFQADGGKLIPALLVIPLVGVALYGAVVGSFTLGTQLLIAPAKLLLGLALAFVICFPSLYIFTALDGIDARPRTIAGGLLAALGVAALLLIGFSPVAWIFSQSTDSTGFVATLDLLFWVIAFGFGARLLRSMMNYAGSGATHLRIWIVIFFLVCFQLTATLRPIIAPSAHFFPREKKFFLTHWFEVLNGKS